MKKIFAFVAAITIMAITYSQPTDSAATVTFTETVQTLTDSVEAVTPTLNETAAQVVTKLLEGYKVVKAEVDSLHQLRLDAESGNNKVGGWLNFVTALVSVISLLVGVLVARIKDVLGLFKGGGSKK